MAALGLPSECLRRILEQDTECRLARTPSGTAAVVVSFLVSSLVSVSPAAAAAAAAAGDGSSSSRSCPSLSSLQRNLGIRNNRRLSSGSFGSAGLATFLLILVVLVLVPVLLSSEALGSPG